MELMFLESKEGKKYLKKIREELKPFTKGTKRPLSLNQQVKEAQKIYDSWPQEVKDRVRL